MIVGVATVTLGLPESASLKDKRRVVKSVIARLRDRFNVAVAEVDTQEVWQTATLGIACLSTEAAHAHAMLEKAIAAIADSRLDAELEDYRIELW